MAGCAACEADHVALMAEVLRLRALVLSYERAIRVWVRAADEPPKSKAP